MSPRMRSHGPVAMTPSGRASSCFKKREMQRLIGKIAEQGLTLVPLSIYFTHGLAKVELGLGKGRRTVDKRRQKLKERETAARDATRPAVPLNAEYPSCR